MYTLTGKGRIESDGHLHVELPVNELAPGDVEVVVVIQQSNGTGSHDIRELRGLGKEIWMEQDAQEFIDRLRDEWDD